MKPAAMVVTTTPMIEGKRVVQYLGIVTGAAIVAPNAFRDIFAGFRDFFGGRTRSYETVVRNAKNHAVGDMVEQARALAADAVIGVDLDHENVGKTMLMVSANGTAVRLE